MKIIKTDDKLRNDKLAFLRKISSIRHPNTQDEFEMASQMKENHNYKIEYAVELDNEEWNYFLNNSLSNMDWIQGSRGGTGRTEEDKKFFKVIRVFNKNAEQEYFVNPEGYNYPRYVAEAV